jgi:HSP20 family molecular chaperone IbpA
MATMLAVGNGHPARAPAHAAARRDDGGYVVELDVSDFSARELSVETLGRRVCVRGDQGNGVEDADDPFRLHKHPFRLHKRLEVWFRLPDDADAGAIHVVYRGGTLEISAPRTRLVPRVLAVERRSCRINPAAEAC